MMDKALIALIFMYGASFSILGAQYIIGDVLKIDLVSPSGVTIKSNLLGLLNQGNINVNQVNGTTKSIATVSSDPIGSAASMIWELVLLLTGTYIFNVLYLFGVPAVFILGFVTLYGFLVMRAIPGWIRGI